MIQITTIKDNPYHKDYIPITQNNIESMKKDNPKPKIPKQHIKNKNPHMEIIYEKNPRYYHRSQK